MGYSINNDGKGPVYVNGWSLAKEELKVPHSFPLMLTNDVLPFNWNRFYVSSAGVYSALGNQGNNLDLFFHTELETEMWLKYIFTELAPYI